MEEHKYVYSSKFPIDPFKRDNIFKESAILAQELTASQVQNSMQRKQQSFNMKNVLNQ